MSLRVEFLRVDLEPDRPPRKWVTRALVGILFVSRLLNWGDLASYICRVETFAYSRAMLHLSTMTSLVIAIDFQRKSGRNVEVQPAHCSHQLDSDLVLFIEAEDSDTDCRSWR